MKWLKEVDIIRSLVIIVLVFYHAFAPFTGNWDVLPNLSYRGGEYYILLLDW